MLEWSIWYEIPVCTLYLFAERSLVIKFGQSMYVAIYTEEERAWGILVTCWTLHQDMVTFKLVVGITHACPSTSIRRQSQPQFKTTPTGMDSPTILYETLWVVHQAEVARYIQIDHNMLLGLETKVNYKLLRQWNGAYLLAKSFPVWWYNILHCLQHSD